MAALTFVMHPEEMSKSNVSDTEESSVVEDKTSSRIVRGCMVVKTLDDSLHRGDSHLRQRARCRQNIRSAEAAGVNIEEKLEYMTNTEVQSCEGRLEHLSLEKTLNVSFDVVNIREYPVTLGDNPGVSAGPSLTIDWEPQAEVEIPLEQYETTRPPRRDYMEMSIPKDVRMTMLENSGHTKKEILASIRSTNIGRMSRKKTNSMSHMHDTHEAIESFRRAMRHVITFKKHKKKERALFDLFDQFQRKRTEEALRVENEAAMKEARILKQMEELENKINRKRTESSNIPPGHASEEKDQVSECADDSQKHEENGFQVEHSIEADSNSNKTIVPKPIISCEEG